VNTDVPAGVGAPPLDNFFVSLWVGHLWLNGWSICHLMGGAFIT